MKFFAFLYLFLYLTFLKLYCGSLALLCFRYWVRDARWIAPLTAPALLGLRFGAWLAAGFVVLYFLRPWLYPSFSGPGLRSWYGRGGFFALRGALYFACWLALARAAQRARPWAAGGGLVLLTLTVTFAAIDWEMALRPELGSTAFGLVFFLSANLAAFACALFHGAAVSSPEERRDQGSVHLALLCVFVYVAFMQFLIVWAGNIPREVAWYAERVAGAWRLAPATLAVAQFGVPFLLLLQRGVKRSETATRALAALTVSQQVLFTAWEVLPGSPLPAVLGLPLAFAFTAVILRLPLGSQHAPA